MVNVLSGFAGDHLKFHPSPFFVWGVNWLPAKNPSALVDVLVIRVHTSGQCVSVHNGSIDLARPDLGGDDFTPWIGTDNEDLVYSLDDQAGLVLPRGKSYSRIYRFNLSRAPLDTEKYILYVRPLGEVNRILTSLVLSQDTVHTWAYSNLVSGHPLHIGVIAQVTRGSWRFAPTDAESSLVNRYVSTFELAAEAEAGRNPNI